MPSRLFYPNKLDQSISNIQGFLFPFTAIQDFTHFEPSQTLIGGEKLEIRKNNHRTTCNQNLACLRKGAQSEAPTHSSD